MSNPNPILPSPATQNLLNAAGQAAADNQQAQQQVASDQGAIAGLQSQMNMASQTLTTDQSASASTETAAQAAYLAAIQSYAADLGVPLPLNVPPASPATQPPAGGQMMAGAHPGFTPKEPRAQFQSEGQMRRPNPLRRVSGINTRHLEAAAKLGLNIQAFTQIVQQFEQALPVIEAIVQAVEASQPAPAKPTA
jgi:hypothetical protein